MAPAFAPVYHAELNTSAPLSFAPTKPADV